MHGLARLGFVFQNQMNIRSRTRMSALQLCETAARKSILLTLTADKKWGLDVHSMQQWEKADSGDRESSALRIYCDNDKRFKKVDPKEQIWAKYLKNADTKVPSYIDDINKILVRDTPSCMNNDLRSDGWRVLASTVGGRNGVLYPEAPFDNYKRVSVTVRWTLKRHTLLVPVVESRTDCET